MQAEKKERCRELCEQIPVEQDLNQSVGARRQGEGQREGRQVQGAPFSLMRCRLNLLAGNEDRAWAATVAPRQCGKDWHRGSKFVDRRCG